MEKIVSDTISNLYPKLKDKQLLSKNVMKVITAINNKLGFNNKLTDQLKINNYKDTISLIKMTLPYIPKEKTAELTSLNEILVRRDEDGYYFSTMAKGLDSGVSFNIEEYTDNLVLTIGKIMDKLYVNWIDIFPNRNGVNSKITFNPQFNNYVDEENYKKRVKKNAEFDKYKNSKYFLTDEPFRNLYGKNGKGSYFDLLKEDGMDWYFTYAMNWVSQINFFHHFMNNRVIMVTGSTGAGKSSQIPKLLLYALKALYGRDGKIICTQPRIKPAEDNPKRIATELGVPIGNEKFTYMQYQHSQDKNTANKSPFIRMVTDKILLLLLMKNPTLKGFDIIIVDEVHEHNTNMDLILTLMKRALQENTRLKLVLISATLDADEARYRQFFKDVEDNILLDRRLDISVPGTGTRYEIVEKYYPEVLPFGIGKINDDILDKVIAKTVEIMDNHSGDTLLFVTGSYDVKYICGKIVEDNLMPETILVPFYRDVITNFKELIDGELLRDKAQDLRYSREYLNNHLLNIGDEVASKTSTVRYRKKLVIATNIAEASVTIPRMINVIDMGLEKVSRHNIYTDMSNLLLKPITLSSQIQRRGRVGRIASGFVFYLYSQDNISLSSKESYNIVNEDIHLSILQLLEFYSKDELIDETGEFYLIHPDELSIKRDENGIIVNPILPRMKEMFKLLERMELIRANGEITKLGQIVSNMAINEIESEQTKTVSGSKPVIVSLYGSLLGCEKEIFFILSALSVSSSVVDLFNMTSDKSLEKLRKKERNRLIQDNLIRGKNAFAKENSDHLTLYYIYNSYKKAFPFVFHELEWIRKSKPRFDLDELRKIAKNRNQTTEKEDGTPLTIDELSGKLGIKNRNINERDIFQQYSGEINGFLSENNLYLDMSKRPRDNFKNIIQKEKELIDKWCKERYIIPEKFHSILKRFYKSMNAFKRESQMIDVKNFLEKDIKVSSNIKNNILTSIYKGFKYNMITKKNGDIYHINVPDKPLISKYDKKVVKYMNTYPFISQKLLYTGIRESDNAWLISGITNANKISEKKTFTSK
jgi:HrpA-like RNA helicase